MLVRLLSVLVLVFGASACAGLSEPADPIRLQTDASSYEVAVTDSTLEFSYGFRYLNLSGRSAFLHGCYPPHPPAMDKLVDGTWRPVYGPIVLSCLSPPFEVAHEDVYRSETTVSAGWPGSDYGPEWQAEEVSGTYRLRWDAEERGQRILVYSNPFTLRPAD